MILFLDTSALVKLYVAEPHSASVHRWVNEADIVAVCRIAWAEFMAATATRARLQADGLPLLQAMSALRRDWPSLAKVEVSQALVERAGELASAFALRGYDSVQLAAAELLLRARPQAVGFGCFDLRLSTAAQSLGLALPATD